MLLRWLHGINASPRDSRTNRVRSHGRCVEDIELGSRIVFGKQGTEHDPAPIPYREPDMPRKLRFGFYLSGAWLPPSRSSFLPPSVSDRVGADAFGASGVASSSSCSVHGLHGLATSGALMTRLASRTMNLAGCRGGQGVFTRYSCASPEMNGTPGGTWRSHQGCR